jgi:hypothetical protein
MSTYDAGFLVAAVPIMVFIARHFLALMISARTGIVDPLAWQRMGGSTNYWPASKRPNTSQIWQVIRTEPQLAADPTIFLLLWTCRILVGLAVISFCVPFAIYGLAALGL